MSDGIGGFGTAEAWLLLSAVLVFVMQIGFCSFESGVVRSKNMVHVAVKNLLDFSVATTMFLTIGYALAMGPTWRGIVGVPSAEHLGAATPYDTCLLIYHMMFCGTAASVVSGAVAERIRTRAYLFIVFIVSAFVYPLALHWAWADGGWLAQIGFIDYAGSTVVHGVGAWCALAAVQQLGPRRGRFTNESSSHETATSSNLAFATVGLLLLWLGWFGFNAGGAYSQPELAPRILLNTLIAPAVGAMTVIVWQSYTSKVYELRPVLCSILGGLVAITATCHAVEPWAATLIGCGGAVVAVQSTRLMEWLRLDDPVDAIACHGIAGVWGTLAAPLFMPAEMLQGGRLGQLAVQAVGVAACFGLSWTATAAAVWLYRRVDDLRVSATAEAQGLSVAEHGARSEYWDLLMQTYGHASPEKNCTLPELADEDEFSEFGQLSSAINQLVRTSEKQTSELTRTIDRTHEGIVKTLVDLSECRDTETAQHIRRIQLYSDRLARELTENGSPYEREIGDDFRGRLARASLLHDIGKVGIPDKILLKPGRFNAEERRQMQKHAEIGAEMLCRAKQHLGDDADFMPMAIDVARSHHEWFDGNGYPSGLAGEEIPLAARIVAVADVFDALVSRRVYKQPMELLETRDTILVGSGSQFDPEVVAAFVTSFEDFVSIHNANRDELTDLAEKKKRKDQHNAVAEDDALTGTAI
ncbi:MAG: HD domain-containing phosphohydrolase [Planctomycetota bacterium]